MNPALATIYPSIALRWSQLKKDCFRMAQAHSFAF
jgi:hypothetical protein